MPIPGGAENERTGGAALSQEVLVSTAAVVIRLLARAKGAQWCEVLLLAVSQRMLQGQAHIARARAPGPKMRELPARYDPG